MASVQNVDDLSLMGEADLIPVLNIIQSRKLLRHWQGKGKDYIGNKDYYVNIYAVVKKIICDAFLITRALKRIGQ